VEFIGENRFPFFDPPLTSFLQIYRQPSYFEWAYPLPEAYDEDINDTVTVTVDL